MYIIEIFKIAENEETPSWQLASRHSQEIDAQNQLIIFENGGVASGDMRITYV